MRHWDRMPFNFQERFQEELQAGLRELEAREQRRTLAEIQGTNLCSNDYLELSRHPALKEVIARAVRDAERVGGTGSRLLSGHAAVWEQLEEEFAQFAGTEAALYFGSGYMANLGLLTALLKKDDWVFSDELNHASLIDGMRLCGARKIIYPHLDLDTLESELRKHAHERRRKLIVTESVFSMEGDIAPVTEIVKIAERYGAGVIVDEAHATGLQEASGRGIAVRDGVAQQLAAVVHTCGKALASAGAFVCGSGALKEHLINHARTFIFSTAMPPYMAEQIRSALGLARGMDREREALMANARRLVDGLRSGGWDTGRSKTQIVPLIIGENEQALSAAEHLQARGFAVRAVRPPTVPPGSARLRFSLTSGISDDELLRLENSLNSWRENLPSSAAVARA
ncbi:MAG TPA: 8-amino-7-oxononanoate synthase [Candidatus Acidoferrum sp.]|nr:8-amino-7-oxononanoate synthase [Candidatus Acidoferrum sp.]